ncbi:archaeosortase/exosortase family protein [Candidatus Aquicultor secundus]|uniref:archaeosortase/exosortase family protein n=1 Tax=Candidatus Aquicultor secundus TaxID=1973895 RepID=UPI00257FB7B1|nr:archaeosortase/exosortase family protein [Candidatus Aquicultor secundus]
MNIISKRFATDEHLKENLAIGVKFFLCALVGVLFVVIPNPVATASTGWIVKLTTLVATWFIKITGFAVKAGNLQGSSDDLIILPKKVLAVNLECTAIYLMIIFAAFVLAFPSDYKNKLIGLAAGIPLIFVANILRLFAIAIVATYSPNLFTSFHDYVWQTLFVVFIIVLWLIWIDKVVQREGQVSLRN